jgi:ATP-dependent DNA helicase PIF1
LNNEFKYTHLYPNKFNVNVKNLVELDKLEGDNQEFHASIISKNNSYIDFPKNTNIQETITLKIGAFIMLTKNIDITQKLVNGTQGIYKGINDTNKLIFQNDDGIHYISKYTWDFDSFKIEQFPICLAWAMTIHKSQGMGIDYLSIDIGDNVFEDGQSYVALSRSTNIKGLHIKKFSKSSIKTNAEVLKFYKNLNKLSKIWFSDIYNDRVIYINKLDGRRVYKIPSKKFQIEEKKDEDNILEIEYCRYSNYDEKCSVCNAVGCRNDLLNWYKERICTNCVTKNKDYQQIGKNDIYKLFSNLSKKFINTKLKLAPCKIFRYNNRYRTKTKIYLLKNLKEILVKSKKIVKNKTSNVKNATNVENSTDILVLSNEIIEKLKKYRYNQSKLYNLPSYCIFTNKTLHDLSVKGALSKEDLFLINGLGSKKIEKYGEDILDIIKK